MRRVISSILATTMLIASFTVGICATADNGNDVKVEAKKIEKFEEDCGIKIIYPHLSGFKSASKLNGLIQNKITDSIGSIRCAWSDLLKMKEEQKKAGEEISKVGVSLGSTFDYSKNGKILSVMMNESFYMGGAHDLFSIDSFTVNTKTGEIYSFNSLFNQKSNYKKVVVDKISTMIQKEKDSYFGNAMKTLAEMKTDDFQFYIDGSNLVIYFDLYDLAPYAYGIPKFTIAVKDLKGLLKDEVYSQVINAKSLTKTRFNGRSITLPYKTYENGYSLMVQLKFFAETLGYKVTWDSQKGASIAGGFIQNNVNSYYTDKTKESSIKLTQPAKIINYIMYVPIEYFSQVLKENVSYDGEVVRLYKFAATQESQFDKQIIDFCSPVSAEQCVQMYANAVKERKGAIQYALFSEKLREAKKSYFEELNWVTGVSSPWVTGYDIENSGKGTYNIVFHWATSAGTEADSTTKITVENRSDEEFWQITSLQE